jgi:hypothetical protein
VKKLEISQHSKYTCGFCGKVRRFSVLFVTSRGLVRFWWKIPVMVSNLIVFFLNCCGGATGRDKASGRRHLEVHCLQEVYCWWRLHPHVRSQVAWLLPVVLTHRDSCLRVIFADYNSTPTAVAVRSTLRRMRELAEVTA